MLQHLFLLVLCESYPSKIRDLSKGFMNSIANFRSFARQLIFISLYDINKDNFIYKQTFYSYIIYFHIINFLY